MARKVRLEYAGAFYHVINRGNYRSWIFETAGARTSFLECLQTCCGSTGWRLHAWCVMGNHYHLLVETPEPNLVEGMRWLQSTFANRFNRFRKANGHVFQGRYKAILIDPDLVGRVCHYIHLNPVRAGLIAAGSLEDYLASSFHHLWFPDKRWPCEDFSTCLQAVGGGSPDRVGIRRSYRDYLCVLASDEAAQEKLGFPKMSRGWVKGGREFKSALLQEIGEDTARRVVEAEASELRQARWERCLSEALRRAGKTEEDLRSARKGAEWKVALACELRDSALAANKWIAERLHMGTAGSVQCLVSNFRRSGKNYE